MHILSASGLGHGYDGRTLFEDLSFGLSDTDEVAIVGPNGSGKSTLLRILAGQVVPDQGSVTVNRAARVVHLEQAPVLRDDATALEVTASTPGVRAHQAEALLDRFGIDAEAPLGRLSGGQRRRVSLVEALVVPSDLLILDEPTNHLDAQAIERLEDHLARRTGAVALVTHDRYLLDRVTTRLLDLHDRPTWVEGTYRDVLAARDARAVAHDRAARSRRSQLRRELAWLQRSPRARGTKADHRVDQAHRLRATVADDDRDDGSDLVLATGRRRLGTKVLDVEGLVVARGGSTIVGATDLALGRGDRVAIVGRNGAGKSSLLAALNGDIEPAGGRVTWGPTVERGLYRQEARATPTSTTVLDTITAIATNVPLADGTTLPAARLAERFGFDDRLVRTPVGDLSGGERRRLALLHLLVAAPNVILLDEPTNDLDLDTLRALEHHLEAFDGTLVVASHDRFLLDRLTTRVLAVHGGRLREVPDWAAARDLVESTDRVDRPGPVEAPASTGATTTSRNEERDRGRHQRRRRRRLALERRMDRLTRAVTVLEDSLVAAGADVDRATRLHADLERLRTELAQVEDDWLEVAT